MEPTSCKHCGHSEEDHVGHWAGGELIPGKLCYYMENQGYQQDLCQCPGFDVPIGFKGPDYLSTLLAKAGVE